MLTLKALIQPVLTQRAIVDFKMSCIMHIAKMVQKIAGFLKEYSMYIKEIA
jgi:hypothetical protein